jgi:hypothetical protein
MGPIFPVLFGATIASNFNYRPHLPGQEKFNFSTVFAGQAAGIKEVHDNA